ncbi:hypothetical protein [Micromonospora sagamiensis]|uniref:Uncharacterized protein n=1 Tax=Micromonospora sagamiensis TaxID=47875 RepID=A0A562W8S6_9ACTN|nr:hypothetical protein [Micromonospora sagamiensis]TWJ26660.1 hypothetical protein JD81_00122 [Micromonospora sagamiensis]
MGVFGPRIFVFDELFTADQTLRGQARAVREAAGDLTVPAGDLPPEARSVLSGLGALRGRLERAADALTEAATTLGQIGAAAQRADSAGWLAGFGASLRSNVLPPGAHGPLGPYPWVFGRLTSLNSAAGTMLRHRYGYPWVKDGDHWRVNGSGPRLHPRLRTWADRASKAGKVAGPAAIAANSLNNRLRDGASLPKASAGAVGESATVFGCATAGAKLGAAAPVPHPLAKGALAVGGGVVGGAACSGPGKWVGDKVSGGASKVAGFVGKILP